MAQVTLAGRLTLWTGGCDSAPFPGNCAALPNRLLSRCRCATMRGLLLIPYLSGFVGVVACASASCAIARSVAGACGGRCKTTLALLSTAAPGVFNLRESDPAFYLEADLAGHRLFADIRSFRVGWNEI